MSNVDGATKFNLRSTKHFLPKLTLSTKDSVKLRKQLHNGFERSIYSNKYNCHVLAPNADSYNLIRIKLDFHFLTSCKIICSLLFLMMLMVMQIKLKKR